MPLGAAVAPFLQTMETNGEAMDFVIFQHEWVGTTAQLTPAGQAHLMQIARRLADVPYPVIIEPVTFRPFDEKRYEEKHFTDMTRERREALELDLARRENLDADRRAEIDAARRQEVVQFLASLNYPYANERVFVASPYVRGLTGVEAARAYHWTLTNQGAFGFGQRGLGGF